MHRIGFAHPKLKSLLRGLIGSGVEGATVLAPTPSANWSGLLFAPTRSWTTPRLSPLPDRRQPQKTLALGCS
jgi:hypothetical protein